jgi:hypothetical protein
MSDPTTLLRIITGESVFGMDVDSKIRQASHCMSARLMLEFALLAPSRNARLISTLNPVA